MSRLPPTHDPYGNPLPSQQPIKDPQKWMKDIFNTGDTDIINTDMFKNVDEFVKKHTHVELTGPVTALNVLLPLKGYGEKTFTWLKDNGTNSIEIDGRLAISAKLRAWVDLEPSTPLLSHLPSFRHLSMDATYSNGFAQQRGKDTKQSIAWSGNRFFVHNSVPFNLYKPNTQPNCTLTLRVVWPSHKPIVDLLEAVNAVIPDVTVETPTIITKIGHKCESRESATKRSIATIDMEPEVKKDLEKNVRDFFSPNSTVYYRRNGTPYRRGYMLYGPPGTGKTSLSQAIASEYDVELFFISLAGMGDAELEKVFKNLPPRCVVLIEDIDSAGIVREDMTKSVNQVHVGKNNHQDIGSVFSSNADDEQYEEDYDDQYAEAYAGEYNEDPKAYYATRDIATPPGKSFVTLSGLLNVVDGPGSKEGRLLIFTTNAPDSLDSAMFRPGRIDKKFYLGFSGLASAARTFIRMFGTDPDYEINMNVLERLVKRFGKHVPEDLITPCEVQEFCKQHRGNPRAAIKNIRQFVEDRISGKHEFKYVIQTKPMKPAKDRVLEQIEDSDSEGEDVVIEAGHVTNDLMQDGGKSVALNETHAPLRAVSPRPMDDVEFREFAEKVGDWEPDYWGSDHAFVGWSGF